MNTRNPLRRTFIFGILILASAAISHAVVLADWSVSLYNQANPNPNRWGDAATGYDTTSGPRHWTPGAVASNLVVGSLDKGAGVADTDTTTDFANSVFGGIVGRHASLADAIASQAYMTFSVAPATGYYLTIGGISVGATNYARTTGSASFRSNDPSYFQWQVSIDGGAFVNFGDAINPANNTTTASAREVIPASDLFIADGSEAVFRLVAYGDNAESTNRGRWALGSGTVSAVQIHGEVTPAIVPEPSAYAAIAGGLSLAAVACRRRRRA